MPLGSLIHVRNDSGPVFVMRYNDVNTAAVNGGTLPGFSSGQAISVMQQLCDENLPAGMWRRQASFLNYPNTRLR